MSREKLVGIGLFPLYGTSLSNFVAATDVKFYFQFVIKCLFCSSCAYIFIKKAFFLFDTVRI
jgi:hypothetical protein